MSEIYRFIDNAGLEKVLNGIADIAAAIEGGELTEWSLLRRGAEERWTPAKEHPEFLKLKELISGTGHVNSESKDEDTNSPNVSPTLLTITAAPEQPARPVGLSQINRSGGALRVGRFLMLGALISGALMFSRSALNFGGQHSEIYYPSMGM